MFSAKLKKGLKKRYPKEALEIYVHTCNLEKKYKTAVSLKTDTVRNEGITTKLPQNP